jgi:hypothetical protein
MADVRLFLWDISVAVGIFGFGKLGLRLLKIRRPPLAVTGCFGISLWIALGGYLNLLHLLRPSVFFILVGTGIVLALIELVLARRDRYVANDQTNSQPPLSLPAKLLAGLAILIIGTMMLGAMRPRIWCFDDMQGYIALGVKAAQTHSIQPDPFCERRVQAGVGGGNFLNTLMYATGDIRAMDFLDSTFGLGLYALGLWAIGRRWKIPPTAIAFALFCLPFAPLIKINLTIIYLSAAGFFAALLLLTDLPPDKRFSTGRILALGAILGGLLTTKTPNVIFVVPFLFFVVVLHRLFRSRYQVMLPVILSLLVAVATFIPWSIANKTNAGTYLYPLLGLGIHISAYHFILTPGQIGTWQQMVLLIAPNLTFLALSLLVAWKLTRHWEPAPRAAAVAYIAAVFLALPVTILGLGGEGADRYTAPLVMPAYLLTLLIVLGSFAGKTRAAAISTTAPVSAFWRNFGVLTVLVTSLYTVAFIGSHLVWDVATKDLVYEAFGKTPPHTLHIVVPLDRSQIQQTFDYGAKIQQSLPPGVTALAIMRNSFTFDFRRNTIYIADFPGMASPPPGLPLTADPETQRRFLIDRGIDYIVYDSSSTLSCPYNTDLHLGVADWPNFVRDERQHFSFHYLLTHEKFTHMYGPWDIVEFHVSCHERDAWLHIVDASPQVYNDGRVIVARIH